MKYTGDFTYEENIRKGYKYYKETFFTAEGASKYYNSSLYPIDIHSPAQLVITVCKLGKSDEDKELMERVLDWTISRMQSTKGFFYFQVWKNYTIRIPYMRWSQAWMFYALSIYLLTLNASETDQKENNLLSVRTIDGI
jgi:hypothetical protein